MTLHTRIVNVVIAMLMLMACSQRKTAGTEVPWGDTSAADTGTFSVRDIMTNGEIIALTLPGPDTYYDYHGHGMGTQYMLCERLALRLGVSVRMELCRDTADMIARLVDGDGDLIAVMMPRSKGRGLLFAGAAIDSLNVQWAVAEDNRELADTLNNWFRPSMLAEVRREQSMMLSRRAVTRRTYAPFLDRSAGVISKYDALFRRYAPVARWDWRLMAAQCYQESCFDPRARSWAGACGLMQIMPATAAHLGLPMSRIYDPEPNISAATKFISQLSTEFSDVRDASQRQLFVLAAYNGGTLHIRDAMALARKNGHNPHSWGTVSRYVLALQRPEYYNDPVVKHGYMRGSETVDYVERIRQRYSQYRGVPYKSETPCTDIAPDANDEPQTHGFNYMTPRKAQKKHRFKI